MHVEAAWTEGSTVSGTERRRDEHSRRLRIAGDCRPRNSREFIDTVVHRELRSAEEAALTTSRGRGGGWR